MDNQMQSNRHFIKFSVNYHCLLKRTLSVLFIVQVILCSTISNENYSFQRVAPLDISFDQFSPAFAAFEDEYLFANEEEPQKPLAAIATPRLSEKSSDQERIDKSLNPSTPKFSLALASAYTTVIENKNTQKQNFKSERTLSSPINSLSKKELSRLLAAEREDFQKNLIPNFTLSVNKDVDKPYMASNSETMHKEPLKKQTANLNSLPESPSYTPHHLRGTLELTGGLVFLGEMEVAWFDKGVEQTTGRIHQDTGIFEIEVGGIRGQIVVSLFDQEDQLIGEGSIDLDLARASNRFSTEDLSISLREVDVHLAGKIRTVYSVGTNHDGMVSNAEVMLYSFDDLDTSTDLSGQFRVPHWKRSNSKSLARASKEGYVDSIFLLDSNQEADVIMLSESYLENYFSFLSEKGFDYRLASAGMVYGVIQNKDIDVSGVTVEIDGFRTVYFESFLASPERTTTDESGIFTIVGLDAGDHLVRIFKNNELIDSHIVAVESKTVSPLVLSLEVTGKTLEFIDPINNSEPKSTVLSFFDGEMTLQSNPIEPKIVISKGTDPSLFEFAHENGLDSLALISRDRIKEKIPFLSNHWLKHIEEKLSLKPEDGVAIGFFENQGEPFRISVLEGQPRITLYFDKSMHFQSAPFAAAVGFVLSGMEMGLHSLVFETPEQDEIFSTDLIFIDGERISVLNK